MAVLTYAVELAAASDMQIVMLNVINQRDINGIRTGIVPHCGRKGVPAFACAVDEHPFLTMKSF